MMSGKPLTKLCFFLFSFMLVSCAAQYQNQKNTVAHLRQAVDKLWSARIDQDWKTLYTLTDKAYQETISQEEFITSGGLKKVLDFEIINIKAVDDKNYEVVTKMKIETMGFVLSPLLTEYWLFQSDTGWALNMTKMFFEKPF